MPLDDRLKILVASVLLWGSMLGATLYAGHVLALRSLAAHDAGGAGMSSGG
ncbi:hypothetical protein L6R50_22335 [Myxococcota bacterium]|nr:hypothetical protein [Myxococcota bacterium]